MVASETITKWWKVILRTSTTLKATPGLTEVVLGSIAPGTFSWVFSALPQQHRRHSTLNVEVWTRVSIARGVYGDAFLNVLTFGINLVVLRTTCSVRALIFWGQVCTCSYVVRARHVVSIRALQTRAGALLSTRPPWIFMVSLRKVRSVDSWGTASRGRPRASRPRSRTILSYECGGGGSYWSPPSPVISWCAGELRKGESRELPVQGQGCFLVRRRRRRRRRRGLSNAERSWLPRLRVLF